MTKPVRIALYGLTFALSAVAGNALWKWYESTTPPAVAAEKVRGTIRPAFALPDLSGRVRNVSEWDGKVLVINFWATWCPPCKREIPAFMALQALYGTQGVQFVGVALDEAVKVQDYVDVTGIEYPTLLGENSAIDVAIQFGNDYGALPYTAIVDRDGRIAYTFRGEVSRETAEESIRSLL